MSVFDPNIFDSAMFDTGATGSPPVGGGGGGGQGFSLKRWRRERIALEETLREAYQALSGTAAEVKATEIVAPYVDKETQFKVDWRALAADLAAVDELLELAQQEEEAVVLLMM